MGQPPLKAWDLELDLWASDSLIIAMLEEILYLIYLTLIPILLFAIELCAGSSQWFGFHHPSDLLGPLSSNTWFHALCHLGSGSIILNLFLASLKHLLNPVTQQSGCIINLLITVIIYHPNKCHGIGCCYPQYLTLNSVLSQAKNNLWWNLLATPPIHGRSPWELFVKKPPQSCRGIINFA